MAPPRRPWLRLYVEVVHDWKLRRLRPAERWLWVALLSCARESPIPGHLLASRDHPLTEDELAAYAAVPVSTVNRALPLMREYGMLDRDKTSGAWVVVHWSERQFETDQSAGRVARHRRPNEEAGDVDVTAIGRYIDVTSPLHHAPCNGDATAMEARCNGDVTAPETDTDTETAASTATRSTEPAEAAADSEAEAWAPQDAQVAWARKALAAGIDIGAQTSAYVADCEASGRRPTATGWRKWMLLARPTQLASPQVSDAAQLAQRKLAVEAMARLERPCRTCDGAGMVEDAAGSWSRCGACGGSGVDGGVPVAPPRADDQRGTRGAPARPGAAGTARR